MRRRLLLVTALLLASGPARGVVFDWVTVGDPGNAADTTGFGAIGGSYQVGRYEVTNAQYAEFLNAVAEADPNGLYNSNMASGFGGITRFGPAGGFFYLVNSGAANRPVNFVSFWDALRFANWVHNGQPTGAQGPGTTEDGSYTLTPAAIAANTVTRNPGASVFVTGEDEWYKAAYYVGGGTSAGYWTYPTRANAPPTAEAPPGADLVDGSANYASAVGSLTDVGAYTARPSDGPYGSFDQGGNVREWNEAILNGVSRGLRGGGLFGASGSLASSNRSSALPTFENSEIGFRLARPVPAAEIPSLGPAAAVALALGLLVLGLIATRAAARR